MSEALSDDAVEPKVVVLPGQAVPAPVPARAAGRAHRDRAQADGRIACSRNHHGPHVATPKTECPALKSLRAGQPGADNKIALPLLAYALDCPTPNV